MKLLRYARDKHICRKCYSRYPYKKYQSIEKIQLHNLAAEHYQQLRHVATAAFI